MEADEVKKASIAKLKHRNKGSKEIKNPTAAVKKSERHDEITQIVQDSKFTSDVAPAKGDDNIVPQADFADTYTKKMAHGQTAAIGKGENEKSPKGTGSTSMTPNQTTNLKQIKNEIKGTDDDGSQKVFTIPQAKFADEYTKVMSHGEAGGTTNEEGRARFGSAGLCGVAIPWRRCQVRQVRQKHDKSPENRTGKQPYPTGNG